MKTFCDYKPPFTEKQYVTRDFTKGGGMSSEFLSIGLRQYATADEANAAFDAMADAIGSCPGDTFQGTELTYAPMSAPKIGDASVGVRITADGTDLLQFFVLTGPTIIRTGGGRPHERQPRRGHQASRSAARRLRDGSHELNDGRPPGPPRRTRTISKATAER
ncbi:MAG: hypothetical protein R2701_00835 [Acidimicrobiales bacterium]